MAFDLSDYNDVPSRIAEFRKAHPEGTLQSEIVQSPFDGFIAVKGYAYRSLDDPRPGTGLAWEPVPGLTPYTKNSELQNAETSAWGRAIIAVGAADARKGIATQEEIRNRRDEAQAEPSQEELEKRGTNKLKAEALDLMGDPDEAKGIYDRAVAEVGLAADEPIPVHLQGDVRKALQEIAP